MDSSRNVTLGFLSMFCFTILFQATHVVSVFYRTVKETSAQYLLSYFLHLLTFMVNKAPARHNSLEAVLKKHTFPPTNLL